MVQPLASTWSLCVVAPAGAGAEDLDLHALAELLVGRAEQAVIFDRLLDLNIVVLAQKGRRPKDADRPLRGLVGADKLGLELALGDGDYRGAMRGVAQKCLLHGSHVLIAPLRHLVLPHQLAGTRDALRRLADEVSPEITVSLMAQYYPTYRAATVPELSRTITAMEYDEALDAFADAGLENGWAQDVQDAPDTYRPDFRDDHPFER